MSRNFSADKKRRWCMVSQRESCTWIMNTDPVSILEIKALFATFQSGKLITPFFSGVTPNKAMSTSTASTH